MERNGSLGLLPFNTFESCQGHWAKVHFVKRFNFCPKDTSIAGLGCFYNQSMPLEQHKKKKSMLLKQGVFIIKMETEICGYCEKEFDREYWIGTEKCVHCGEFLDNPPNIKLKK